MANGNVLFAAHSLRERQEKQKAQALAFIEKMAVNELLATPAHVLVAEVTAKHSDEQIALREDQRSNLGATDCKIDVTGDLRYGGAPWETGRRFIPGYRTRIAIPFDGASVLFKTSPQDQMFATRPLGNVEAGQLILKYDQQEPNAQIIGSQLEEDLRVIRDLVARMNSATSSFRAQLANDCQQAVALRRMRLEKMGQLDQDLGLPVRRLEDAPRPVPVTRKRARITELKQTVSGESGAGWKLEDAVYEDVIEIIISMGRAFERSPSAFKRLHEETLRDFLLVQLNGTYEGRAGGELFNGDGKADLVVRFENRNVFIGECKRWDGAAHFDGAIDQLLGYTVWRDTKAALIVFITAKDATASVEQIDGLIRAHSNFKQVGVASGDSDTRRNFVLRHGDDEAREIRLALLPVVIRSVDEG